MDNLKPTTIEQAGVGLITTADQVLDAIASAFPDLAGQGLTYYVQFIMADGAASIISATAIIIATIALCKFLYNVVLKPAIGDMSKPHTDYHESESRAFGLTGGFILMFSSILLIVVQIGVVRNGIVKIIAPEGYVINKIVSEMGEGSKSNG